MKKISENSKMIIRNYVTPPKIQWKQFQMMGFMMLKKSCSYLIWLWKYLHLEFAEVTKNHLVQSEVFFKGLSIYYVIAKIALPLPRPPPFGRSAAVLLILPYPVLSTVEIHWFIFIQYTLSAILICLWSLGYRHSFCFITFLWYLQFDYPDALYIFLFSAAYICIYIFSD